MKIKDKTGAFPAFWSKVNMKKKKTLEKKKKRKESRPGQMKGEKEG